MALINCKECGKEISDAAEKCPHCGGRTAHGQSMAETRGYLIGWIIAVAIFLVGLVMCLSNTEEYMDLADYLDQYKYFYDEDKAVVRNYVLGWIFMIAGGLDVWYMSSKLKGMQRGAGRMNEAENSTTWECSRCFSMNTSGSSSCTRCGASRNQMPRPQVQEKIPAWKLVEQEKRANEGPVDVQRNSASQDKSDSIRCKYCAHFEPGANRCHLYHDFDQSLDKRGGDYFKETAPDDRCSNFQLTAMDAMAQGVTEKRADGSYIVGLSDVPGLKLSLINAHK